MEKIKLKGTAMYSNPTVTIENDKYDASLVVLVFSNVPIERTHIDIWLYFTGINTLSKQKETKQELFVATHDDLKNGVFRIECNEYFKLMRVKNDIDDMAITQATLTLFGFDSIEVELVFT